MYVLIIYKQNGRIPCFLTSKYLFIYKVFIHMQVSPRRQSEKRDGEVHRVEPYLVAYTLAAVAFRLCGVRRKFFLHRDELGLPLGFSVMELYRHGFHLEVFSRIDARQHPRSGMDQLAKPHARPTFASTRFTLMQKPTLSEMFSFTLLRTLS